MEPGIDMPSNFSFDILSGETIKISVDGDDASFIISHVSLIPKDLPETGRVVLYAGHTGDEKVAVAPLRVRDAEVQMLTIEVIPDFPLEFTLTGDKIGVTLSGYTNTTEEPKIEKL